MKSYLQLINNPWRRAMLNAQQESKLLAKYLLTQEQKHYIGGAFIRCSCNLLCFEAINSA